LSSELTTSSRADTLQQRSLQEPNTTAPSESALSNAAHDAEGRSGSGQASEAKDFPSTPADNSSAAVSSSAQTSSAQTSSVQTSTQSLVSTPDATPTTATPPAANATAPTDDLGVNSNPLSRLPKAVGHLVRVRAIISGRTQNATVMLPLSGASVGQALKLMGIKLGPLDRVQPLANRTAYDGMTVRVTRVRADIRKHTRAIAFETRYKPTATIARGTKQTVQRGRKGVLEVTERVWFLNGKYTKAEAVSRRVVKPAQHTVVALGTRSPYVPNRIPYHRRYARAYGLSARGGSPRDRFVAPANPGTFRALKHIDVIATGYSPDPRENGGWTVTATGLPIGYGAAAVDPRVIPLGTKMYVEGYGYAFACDVGGAIKGKRIDLAYDSYRVANTKGRRKVRVWILGP
jgi:3D (Asp-Asp-Asp) domain-containing protein